MKAFRLDPAGRYGSDIQGGYIDLDGEILVAVETTEGRVAVPAVVPVEAAGAIPARGA